MKILYVTPGCFDKGGISRYSRYQIEALREVVGEGSVRVLSLLGPDENSFESPFPVRWHGRGNAGRDKASLALHLFGESLAFGPDLIWTAHVNFSGLSLGAARFVGAEAAVNTYGLEVWSGLSPDASWGLRKSARVLSDCHWTARYLEESGLRPAGSTPVLWDCVDLDRYRPGPFRPEVAAAYGIPDPSLHRNILSLGRLTTDAQYKGYARLLEVFARLAPEVAQARLIYAGKGDLVAVLKERAAALGLSDKVCFTGPVHEDHMADVYRSAHVFSMVGDAGESRGEGIPLTPLEASACGLPILVGNQDGSQEAVENGVGGYALDPFVAEAHAGAIADLLNDEDLCRRMGEASRRRAEEHFSYTAFREKHRGLLDSWSGFSPEVIG